MRCPRSRLRRTAVFLLLALRAGQRSIRSKRGLPRSSGFREAPVGTAPPHGRVPPEGRTGVRAEASPDRESRPDGAYLHLEVRGGPHSPSPMAAVSRVRLPRPIALT